MGGIVLQLHWRSNLCHPPVAQHDDLVGQCHGFGLVVSDVDRGCGQRAVQFRDFNWRIHRDCTASVWWRVRSDFFGSRGL